MITKKLDNIRIELREMAEDEAMKVWRLARRAEAHKCSRKLINEIREEGNNLYNNYTTYPERLLDHNAKYDLKYAFCGERMRHCYITLNGNNEVISVEYR